MVAKMAANSTATSMIGAKVNAFLPRRSLEPAKITEQREQHDEHLPDVLAPRLPGRGGSPRRHDRDDDAEQDEHFDAARDAQRLVNPHLVVLRPGQLSLVLIQRPVVPDSERTSRIPLIMSHCGHRRSVQSNGTPLR